MYVFVKTDGLDFQGESSFLPLSRAGTIHTHVKHLHFSSVCERFSKFGARLMLGGKSKLQKLQFQFFSLLLTKEQPMCAGYLQ